MNIKDIVRRWTHISLIWRIVAGLAVGAVLGLAVPQWSAIGLLGTLFVGALKAVAPVLVALLVTSSIARANGHLGPRFRTVVAEYVVSTLLAAVVAVVGSRLFPVTLNLGGVTSGVASPDALTDVLSRLLSNMVMNPVQAVVSANYVGILFWAGIIGYGLKRLAQPVTLQVVGDLADVVTLAVKGIIQCAPFGICGLVFTTVADVGLAAFSTYGRLLVLLVGCMAANALVFNPLLAFLLLRRNPYPLLFTCLRESGLNAFFTRSSAANIPINMELCRRLRVDEDFYSVSIPLGATINMNGAAVTITVMTMAVAHAIGIEVSFASALMLCAVSALGACGASGVAGGSLLLIPMACSFFGIGNDVAMQAVAVGFIIGVVQDSVETALNSSADVFFTATADMYERRKNGV